MTKAGWLKAEFDRLSTLGVTPAWVVVTRPLVNGKRVTQQGERAAAMGMEPKRMTASSHVYQWSGWPDTTLDDFIAELRQAAEGIPNPVVSIDAAVDYPGSQDQFEYVEITVEAGRPAASVSGLGEGEPQ